MSAAPPDTRDSALPAHAQAGVLRLMFVAAEIYPLAKTGGLADVCGSLPQELSRLGADVRLMMPAYTEALDRVITLHDEVELGEVLPGLDARLIHGWMPDSGLPVWLVDCPQLFQRAGTLYQDPQGRDWEDNAQRFALLSHVAARVSSGRTPLGWKADIVHAHDWHTGLVPLLLRLQGPERPRTVFTIHNMAFQGQFPMHHAERLGLPQEARTPEGAEFHGHLSFLKAGILCADKITTVSPTYAREICTPEFGFGLEGVLQHRSADLLGILNGIDVDVWDPATDVFLPYRYTPEDMQGKGECKVSLQRQLGLQVDPQAPLATSLSRLAHQKMADVLLERLPAMLARHPRLQVAIHGRGEIALEQGLLALVPAFPGRLVVEIGYQETLAHRLQAGADILLHGSRFEPCGLAQLYAMRYGTIPIVRRVGGLADTVTDAGASTERAAHGTGFVFEPAIGEALVSAVERCLQMYHTRPQSWSEMRMRGMSRDSSWCRSARQYADLYAALLPRRALSITQQRRADIRERRTRSTFAALRVLKSSANHPAATAYGSG